MICMWVKSREPRTPTLQEFSATIIIPSDIIRVSLSPGSFAVAYKCATKSPFLRRLISPLYFRSNFWKGIIFIVSIFSFPNTSIYFPTQIKNHSFEICHSWVWVFLLALSFSRIPLILVFRGQTLFWSLFKCLPLRESIPDHDS